MTASKILHQLASALVLIPAVVWSLTSAASEDEYRLGPGDRVKVVIFGHQDLSGEYEVGNEGRLSLPLIKSIPAAGMTVQDIERAITDKLQPGYLKNPRVGVVVAEYRPFYILGEVAKPGSYAYRSNLRVMTAVAVAGGFTERARKNKMFIIRANDPRQKKVRVDPETLVLPGDVIEVSESMF